MLKELFAWILGKGVRLSYTIRFGGGKPDKRSQGSR